MGFGDNQTIQKARHQRVTREERGGHDALHLFPENSQYHRGYLKCCWCMCPRCWQPYGHSPKGPIGRCVCHDCPCGGTMVL